jgi:signal transduction histidine kinase
MKPEVNEFLAALHRGRVAIDAMFEQTGRAGQRAEQVAEALHSLWPSAPLAAGAIWEDGQWRVKALDQAGVPLAEWADSVCRELTRHGTGGTGQGVHAVRLTQGRERPRLVAEEIALGGSFVGILALALPEAASPDTEAGARALLAELARHMALRLGLEAVERERDALREELASLAGLANVGEVTGPMVHEVNNFLNVCQLHVAVLEAEVPDDLRADLVEIRRQGTALTALLRELQKYRQSQQPGPRPVDLNTAVCAAVESFRQQGALGPEAQVLGRRKTVPVVHLQLSDGLPPALGSLADMKRLIGFLLASAATAGADTLTVRTEERAGQLVLRLEDDGPGAAPEHLPRLFEPEGVGRPGTLSLELAACKGLVRRLHGTIQAANRHEGGVAVVVELPVKKS